MRSCSGSDCWLPAVFWPYKTICVFLCFLLPLYELSALQHRLVCHLTSSETYLWILLIQIFSVNSVTILSSIGMFAYTMLATSPLFCYPDWPRRFFARFPAFLSAALPFTAPDLQHSSSCVYPEIDTSSTERQETRPVAKTSKLRLKHKIGAIFTILYIIEQFFLPYSHFITQVHLPLIFLMYLTVFGPQQTTQVNHVSINSLCFPPGSPVYNRIKMFNNLTFFT